MRKIILSKHKLPQLAAHPPPHSLTVTTQEMVPHGPH